MILYNEEARIYDILNQNIPYNLEAKMIEKILDRTSNKTLLDVACGTGEMLKNIQNKKYKCIGCDYSKQMIKIAESKNPSTNFFVGDMKTFQINPKVSVISCLGSAIQYNLNLADLETTIKNLVNNCTDYVVFDTRYCMDKWIDGYHKDEIFEDSKYRIREKWTSKRVDRFSIWEPVYEILDKESGKKFTKKDYHKIMLFTIEEIENILNKNSIKYELVDVNLKPCKDINTQFYFLLQLR